MTIKRHPLEAYADSYAQMSRDGDGRIDCRSVEVDIRQNMIPVTIAASPVQAGIDPLVAEAEYMVENPSAWECFDQRGSDAIAKLIAGFRSQAERIAALEVERDAYRQRQYHIQAGRAICYVSRDGERVSDIYDLPVERMPNGYNSSEELEAAESLLAEAREALEAAVIGLNVWTATYASDMCGEEAVRDAYSRIQNGGGTLAYICGITAKIDATLSRLKPGEKGGE